MRTVMRLIGLVVLLLAIAGLVLCVAGIYGAWKGRAEVTERGERAYTRVDNIFVRVQGLTDEVRNILQSAVTSLRDIKTKKSEARGDPQKELSFGDWAARMMARDVSAKMGNVQPMLYGVSDAVVVAHSVLSELEDRPSDSELKLDQDRLQAMNQRVAEVGTATDKLTNLLGQPGAAGNEELDSETTLVEQKLQLLITLVDEFANKLTEIRDRAAVLKTRTERYLLIGAVAATVLLSWFALSQISLMAHAWSWIRSRLAAAAQPHPPAPG